MPLAVITLTAAMFTTGVILDQGERGVGTIEAEPSRWGSAEGRAHEPGNRVELAHIDHALTSIGASLGEVLNRFRGYDK